MLRVSVLTETADDGFNIESAVIIVTFISVLAVAEILLFFQRPILALLLYSSLVIGSVVIPFWVKVGIGVFQGFGIIGGFRIVDLGMPEVFADPLIRSVFVYAPALFGVGAVLIRSRKVDLQFNTKALFAFPVVIALGVGMALAEFTVLSPEPLVRGETLSQVLPILFFVGFWIALTEELLFRGLLQRAVQHELGAWAGRLVSALTFGALHAVYSEAAAIGLAVVFGLIYALVYDLLEDITTVVTLHTVANALLFWYLPVHGESLALPLPT